MESLGAEPIALGVGIPWVVHEGQVLTVPNLANWNETFDLVEALQQRIDLPIAFGNDATVGLLGEWLNEPPEAHAMSSLCDGHRCRWRTDSRRAPLQRIRGAAGEIAHVVVLAGGALCTCGRRGCVEAYAGRRSMRGVASDMVDTGRKTWPFDIRGEEDKTTLTSKVWSAAPEDKDDLATKLFDTAIETIGIGIGSAVNLLDLDTIGPVVATLDEFVDPDRCMRTSNSPDDVRTVLYRRESGEWVQRILSPPLESLPSNFGLAQAWLFGSAIHQLTLAAFVAAYLLVAAGMCRIVQ